jgi:hypothetical protein
VQALWEVYHLLEGHPLVEELLVKCSKAIGDNLAAAEHGERWSSRNTECFVNGQWMVRQ